MLAPTTPLRPQPDSLWRAMAARAPVTHAPVSTGTPLNRDLSVDVAVIGAGYSGLAAAYALQKRGVDCAVLDANPVGWGASGRNGGVVSSKFRLSFPTIERMHGLDTAKRMHRLAHDGVRVVESLIDEFKLERAQFEHTGSLRCAHTERAFAAIRAEADWVRTALGDTSMTVQTREEVTHETGSTGFIGGVLSADAGTILPLEYVRGLARGLTARRVPIYESTPIVEMTRARTGPGVTLRTPGGTVRAKQVIVATNAYSGLTSATAPYQRELVPFRSAMIATERLPPELDARLMVRTAQLYGNAAHDEVVSQGRWTHVVWRPRCVRQGRSGRPASMRCSARWPRSFPIWRACESSIAGRVMSA